MKINKGIKGFVFVISASIILAGCGTGEIADNSHQSEQTSVVNTSSIYQNGYEDGYRDGIADGRSSAYDNGFLSGYHDGHYDGYSAGYDEGSSAGYSSGHADGEKEGYSSGFEDGYESGVKEASKVDEYSIHTPTQLQYINGNSSTLPPGIGGTGENSRPLPVELKIPNSVLYDKDEVNSYTLRLSEDETLTSYSEYISTTDTFSIYNLKIDYKYYYYYMASTDRGIFSSDVKSFYVKDETPRNLYIDGVTNVRDLGGYKIEDSDNKIAQGLVYRTGRLHSDSSQNITAKGKQQIKDLGIKTEIDLRYENVDSSMTESVVDGVAYYNYQIDYSQSYFTYKANLESIKNVLEIFGSRSKYPIMFHCSIGTDRTGFIGFLINGLAGVSKDSLFRDYMFSNFGSIGSSRNVGTITNYISIINSTYRKNTLSEGIKAYMLDIGVSENTVENIKKFMTGVENPLEHVPDTNWTFLDENYHQISCIDCGETLKKERHSFGDAYTKSGIDDKHYKKCSVCGYEKEEDHHFIYSECECGLHEDVPEYSYSKISGVNEKKSISTITGTSVEYTDNMVLEYTLKMDHPSFASGSAESDIQTTMFELENGEKFGFALGYEHWTTTEFIYAKIITPDGAWKSGYTYLKLMKDSSFAKYIDSDNKTTWQTRILLNNADLTMKMYFRILQNTGSYTDWLEYGNGSESGYEDKKLPSKAKNIEIGSSMAKMSYDMSNIRIFTGSEAAAKMHSPAQD